METAVDPKYTFDISKDPATGEYTASFPALDISHHGTFDEVSEWAMEELARQYGIAIPAPEINEMKS